ncbi:S-adenosyl-L-methionine-dependent methyltransferase [Rhexocercosporidium sp. MPI-PUGE-AT-0058]|nr:S-adenosyl-L-methionine-dependent methyltransferase [Rhexocercosporidium sp. MPI-PUGE-AT-0058]
MCTSSDAAPATAVTGSAVQALQIEPEADTWDDGDSSLGSALGSSTTSIGSSIVNYRKENGRRYHAYKDGKYLFPNDEQENDRLDLQHHLLYLTFKGKLFTAPIPKDQQLHRVLDVGTGTGIWAIDFADEHPESEVVGVDLSPIQPSFIPPNLVFQVDDIEEEWTFANKFDFIYSRMMTGSMMDWPKFFSQSFENLNPGGWIEVVDICLPYESQDGTLKPDSAINYWIKTGIEGVTALGREIHTAHTYKERMIAAGFENVTVVIYQWPTNRWPKDKGMKELGMWGLENMLSSLEGISLAIFTRGLGWSKERLDVLLAEVRKEMKDTRIHAYAPIYVVYGQKPKKT